VNETNPTSGNAKRQTTSAVARGRPAIGLVVGGGLIVLAAAAWAIFTYLNGSAGKSELLVYRLCVGQEQNSCPSDATFVKNVGEDTVTKWAQRQCAGYRSRRIIVNDGPNKDCGCFIADVSCASE
jgi:hypothetical protein